MAKYLVTDTELKSVADAIRTKGGTEEALVFPNGFVSAIETVNVGSAWNDNILCNWDFNNIVNTRGASSYSSGYGFDGWSVYQGTVEKATNGIFLKKDSGKPFMLNGQFLLQGAAVQALYGKTITISALVDDQFGSFTFTASSTGDEDQGHLIVNGIHFYFYRDNNTQMPFYMASVSNDTDNKIIRAVKAEFGSAQTLATQIGGVWTLNKTGIQDNEYFRVRAMVRNS